jgi:hypothetical protein
MLIMYGYIFSTHGLVLAVTVNMYFGMEARPGR